MASSEGTRQRSLFERRPSGSVITSESWVNNKGKFTFPIKTNSAVAGTQITESISHPKDRKTGSYREGGPFYTSLVRSSVKGPSVKDHYNSSLGKFYQGPICGYLPTQVEMEKLGYSNVKGSFGARNESQMTKDGTTAIALTSPTNPAADLGTTIAETMREGIPSLPGIQTWKHRTEILKGLGSEYLNYQFGWAPLHKEVSNVVNAARHHREILQNHQRGEGSDTHRRFDFSPSRTTSTLPVSYPSEWGPPWGLVESEGSPYGTRQVSLVRETKRWFEGVYTYALPSSTDSWRKALGFGSDADTLFGLALNPEILWELTPWSWAVDWFSNTGFVIQNLTSFGLAGLVMRYGYMMEETSEIITAYGQAPKVIQGTIFYPKLGDPEIKQKELIPGTYSCSTESVTKRRVPASPFGFSIGWQDLSPTQLAITAALGITRLL